MKDDTFGKNNQAPVNFFLPGDIYIYGNVVREIRRFIPGEKSQSPKQCPEGLCLLVFEGIPSKPSIHNLYITPNQVQA